MKKLILLPLIFCLFVGLHFTAMASGTAVLEQQKLMESFDDSQIIGLLPEHIQRELAQIGMDSIDPEKIMKVTPQGLFEYVTSVVKDKITSPLKVARNVLASVILLAFLEGLKTTADQNRGVTQVFELISILVVCASFIKPVMECISSSSAAIVDCSNFILSFLPIYSGILIAAGQAAVASVSHVFLFWMCQVTSKFASDALVPMIGFYLVFCIIGVMLPNANYSGISSALKSIIVWSLGLTMTLFVGTLTLSSIVSAGADSLGTRTARFLLGSFVPVVGGALSEAFATAQGCLQLIKGSVGVYGIAASGVIFLPVVAKLVLWYFSANLSNIAAQAFGLSKMSALLKAIASALGILLALVFCLMLILMVSITLILMVGQVVR